MKATTKADLKQYAIYLLVIAIPVLLDIRLLMPVSHLWGWIVDGLIIFGGLFVDEPLQRKFWP